VNEDSMTERELYEKWHSDQGWSLDARWHESQQRYTIFTSTQSKWTAWQACAKIKDKRIKELEEGYSYSANSVQAGANRILATRIKELEVELETEEKRFSEQWEQLCELSAKNEALRNTLKQIGEQWDGNTDYNTMFTALCKIEDMADDTLNT
jgi:hypothetical protein